MRAMTIAALCLALGGCAAQSGSTRWSRVDGRPVDIEPFKLDMTICRGEAQKAALSSGEAPGRAYAVSDVYAGCMAHHGYVAG